MKRQFAYLVSFIVLLGMVSLACGISVDLGTQEPAPAPVQPVQQLSPTAIPPSPIPPTPIPPTPVPPSPIPPTPVQPPTLVPPTVPASTATLGPPMFTADQNSLCRSGPSQIYAVRTSMNLGDTVKIIGKSAPPWDGWWYVEVLGSKCWVWSGLGKTSGDLSGLQVVQAPPTPGAAKVNMTLNNYFIVPICYVYLRDVNNPGSGWGPDILGSTNLINPGQSYTWTGLAAGTYDVSVSDCNGSSLDMKSNIQFNSNTIVTFQ